MRFHKIKTYILKLLNILPDTLGYFLYHQIQRVSFRNIENNIKANQNSHLAFKHIIRETNISLKDKNIMEIGSGWLPIMPYLLKTNENINQIYTFDINKHYNNKRISALDSYYNPNNKFGFNYVYKNGYRLPDFIHYYPNHNIIHLQRLPDVNFYFSRFVLEHVTPNDIKKIHEKLFNEMNHDAAILHLISPSDHRAYTDNTISHYDFLKYSQKEWNAIQTKFDYHNRLRLPQYISIFEEIGFHISYVNYDTVSKDTTKYKEFKKLTIHSDYTQFTEEHILAGSISILLQK